VDIIAITSVTLLQFTHSLEITTFNCTPQDFQVTPSALTTTQLGPQEVANLSMAAPEIECGHFTTRILTVPPPYLSLKDNSLVLAPNLLDPVGIYSLTVKVTNDLSSYTASFVLSVTILKCRIISLTTTDTLKLPTRFVVGDPDLVISLPQFTQTPDC
jgi:hypothetical protein